MYAQPDAPITAGVPVAVRVVSVAEARTHELAHGPLKRYTLTSKHQHQQVVDTPGPAEV
jgi:hypothetical protein